jgi:uncharacterized phage protein (TIGR01671 family)
MREIKFRVWNGMWMEYNVFIDRGKAYYHNPTEEDGYFNFTTEYFDKTPIMRYTGLKDKNNVEVYEGDEVYLDLNNYGIKKCDVKWHDKGACWYFETPKENYFMTDIFYMTDCIEVIGNIYQRKDTEWRDTE